MRLMQIATATPLLSDRVAYVGEVADFPDLLVPTNWPAGHFVLLLIADGSTWAQSHLAEWAEGVLHAGAVYVCCWGPGARFMEGAFDAAGRALEERAEEELPVVMTTSHEAESLDQALWFAASATWPAEEYEETCRSLVVVVVGNPTGRERAVAFLAAGAPPPDED